MDYEVQVGWGKAVPLLPRLIYIPPEEDAKLPLCVKYQRGIKDDTPVAM